MYSSYGTTSWFRFDFVTHTLLVEKVDVLVLRDDQLLTVECG